MGSGQKDKWMAAVIMGVILTFLLISSNAAMGTEISPSPIPGAEYVGVETCSACHEKQAQYFKLNVHYRTGLEETEDFAGEGCESCHGPGSLHRDTQDKTKIIRYSAKMCFSCHMDKRAQFQLQFHHPVSEGRMSCTDCHDVHGRDVKIGSVKTLARAEEVCFKCHKEIKGPFIFEHDAMREGCQTCHNVHGSVFDKLLVAGQNSVCLRCHWEPAVNTVSGGIGGVTHGAGGGNFDIARGGGGRGESCLDHHRAVHGSNYWRTLNR